MTGYVEPLGVPMPLSKLTVRSLRDLGYAADETKADPFVAPRFDGRRLRDKKDKLHMVSDTIKTALKIVPGSPKPGREAEFLKARERTKDRRRKLMEIVDNEAAAAWDAAPIDE
jgi:hypothetical protein